MKKIRMYLYTLVLALVSAFVMHSNSLFAVEEVVINPNSSGEATYIYTVREQDGVDEEGNPKYIDVEKQFSKSRDITIKLNMTQEQLSAYDEKFTICETIPENTAGNSREQQECSIYLTSKQSNAIQLKGRGDGEKVVTITLYTDYASKANPKIITKKIVLDTTGPVITLNGDEYVYLENGEKYTEAGATCVDSNSVSGYECHVTIEEKNIDMTTSEYQYIKYTATDFLDNEVSIYRKIIVNPKEENTNYMFWFFAGGAILILALTLGYVVIKNKEKQKNQSVL